MNADSGIRSLGLIGAGTMGSGMAKNLLPAGFELRVFDLAAARIEALAARGAIPASSATEVVRESQATLASLPTSDTFLQVAETLLPELGEGKVLIDLGTTEIPGTRQMAERIRSAGGDLIDAPVSGGGRGSEAGTLAVMVGGARETFERCRPILETVGGRVVYLGEAGAGQAGKAVNQMAMGVAHAAFLEAMFLDVREGLDPAALWDVLSTAGAANASFARAARQVIDGTAESQDCKLRELPYFIAHAESTGINLPLTEALMAFASKGENRTADPLGIPTPSFWYELNHQPRET